MHRVKWEQPSVFLLYRHSSSRLWGARSDFQGTFVLHIFPEVLGESTCIPICELGTETSSPSDVWMPVLGQRLQGDGRLFGPLFFARWSRCDRSVLRTRLASTDANAGWDGKAACHGAVKRSQNAVPRHRPTAPVFSLPARCFPPPPSSLLFPSFSTPFLSLLSPPFLSCSILPSLRIQRVGEAADLQGEIRTQTQVS